MEKNVPRQPTFKPRTDPIPREGALAAKVIHACVVTGMRVTECALHFGISVKAVSTYLNRYGYVQKVTYVKRSEVSG